MSLVGSMVSLPHLDHGEEQRVEVFPVGLGCNIDEAYVVQGREGQVGFTSITGSGQAGAGLHYQHLDVAGVALVGRTSEGGGGAGVGWEKRGVLHGGRSTRDGRLSSDTNIRYSPFDDTVMIVL